MFTPDELAAWERVRRYAVPPWMIERATERREAGDWRGAMAAANVRVAFDLRDVAAEHGARAAEALEDDLRHLAPDLLRWHLPRTLGGRTTIRTDQPVVLSPVGKAGEGEPKPATKGSGPWLYVARMKLTDGPQRLELRVGEPATKEWRYLYLQDWTLSRHLWDVRRAGELLARVGGTDRPPFFHADGTPLREDELPTSAGTDPVTRAEWVTLLQERGELDEACAAAGVRLRRKGKVPSWSSKPPIEVLREVLTRGRPALDRLAEETRRTGWRRAVFPVDFYWVEVDVSYKRAMLRLVDNSDAFGHPVLPEMCRTPSPDLELLRAGRIGLDDLHPLVRAALFPAAGPPATPPRPAAAALPRVIRVRCRGEWHEVGPDLSIPHDADEIRREEALQALGGSVSGCFALRDAWRTGRGRLPRAARELRRELLLRVQHGDTPGVLELLDAGVDPHVRDGRRRTLLHLLYLLDHEELLPRLLKAGLDLEARDHRDCTPLYMAVLMQGSEKLVRDLIAAGANIHVVDHQDLSLRRVIRRFRRTELMDIAERIDPNLGEDADEWYDWIEDEEAEEDW
jgi:FOG: Ankyrin repeat